MKPEQREALRQDVLRWIQSKSFDAYFTELHLTRGTLGLGLLWSILRPGRMSPAAVIRVARSRGLATGSLKRRYRALAERGQVVFADAWMANAALTAGEVACAPALLIGGAEGTTEAENYVHHITDSLVDLSDRPHPTPVEKEILAMLGEEEYRVFRVRTLPLSYTENYPVYLFDTMLHNSVVAGGDLRVMPFIVCMIHPRMQPAILPIPIPVADRHIREWVVEY